MDSGRSDVKTSGLELSWLPLALASHLELPTPQKSKRDFRPGSELARAGDCYNRHQPQGHSPPHEIRGLTLTLGSTLATSHSDNS
eukprot:6212031-Pleurochrysis_carterae.AAC.2